MPAAAPDPFGVAADLLDPPPWEPTDRPPLEPHQIPPGGKWDLWLLEAGRGAGKTEACARYFAAYMRAHPGHRGRIIAPTFGDAVEACIAGPSGLKAIDPEVRWLPTAPGGAKVSWPNGSQALVLGTPFPPDVDRLRAGGNRHCLVADSPVLTEDGWKPIAAVTPGERVWTREGLRRVTRAGLTGRRETWKVLTEAGRVLEGTADHPLSVPGGWRELAMILPGDILHAWGDQPSSGTASVGTSARTATSRASASSAARRSTPTCGLILKPARDRARAVWPTGRVEPVYDLQIEGAHEFVAAGLIAHNCDWWEEMAANPQLGPAWDQAQLGLRLGAHPHAIASTTPRARPAYRMIRALAGTVLTHATIDDNPHMSEEWRTKQKARYAGTRLGRQELQGELLEDIEGAMWKLAWIEDTRTNATAEPVARRVLGVDPGEGLHAYGLAVLGGDHRIYVTRSGLVSDSAHSFATRMIALAAAEWAEIVVERNHGGSWLMEIFEGAMREMGQVVPLRSVWASTGKTVRAEPVAALYEQGRVSHVGAHPDLEDVLITWDGSGQSPHQLDALVWAISDLSRGAGGGDVPVIEWGDSQSAQVAQWG